VDLSVVVPCFREPPEVLESLVRIEATLGRIGATSEIVAVDDASGDGTVDRLRAWAQGGDGRRLIEHETNTGRGGAVRDGLLAARGRFAGFLDVDLELGPHYILAMLVALDAGADVVTANRLYALRAAPRFVMRHTLSQGYRLMQRRALRLPVADSEAGFKFFRRDAVLPLLAEAKSEGWFWDTEILWLAHRAGLHVHEVPAVFDWRPTWPSSVRVAPTVWEYVRGVRRLRASARRTRDGASA
jgi:dolichyl-phosphate beta-glucosyltransferase